MDIMAMVLKAVAADIVIDHLNATLFLRLRLYRPLYRRLTRVGILDIPASHSQVLHSVIPVPVRDEAVHEDGAIFAVDQFPGGGIGLIVRADAARNYSFTGNWAAILGNLNVRKNAVISLWFFVGDGGVPNLFFRPDGYSKPFQRVHPLPEGLGGQPVNTPVFKGTANRLINFITSTL